MMRTLFACAALAVTLPAAAQIEVKAQTVGPTPPASQAPAAPSPAPCPGMGGLEVGQTRAFSFARMARLEPDKANVTKDLKVVHRPQSRPWTITVTYESESADAKVTGLYYLIDPPSGIGDALSERYGKGVTLATDPSVSYWDIGSCGVRIRYRARMNERQRAIEEMWVEPIPAKQANQNQQKRKG